MMPFSLIDRITELTPGVSITTEKSLRGDENYLQDHFPNFPCMPGVLMLESLYQAGCWLLRKSDEFSRPIVMLKEARNVKYGNFVAPGQTLVVTLNIKSPSDDGGICKVKGQGTVNGKPAVSGILTLEQFRLEDKLQTPAAMDHVSRRNYLKEFKAIYEPAAFETA
jgi:3-hydroxyacyl-[acyl-carrier-protein] dehydratase